MNEQPHVQQIESIQMSQQQTTKRDAEWCSEQSSTIAEYFYRPCGLDNTEHNGCAEANLPARGDIRLRHAILAQFEVLLRPQRA